MSDMLTLYCWVMGDETQRCFPIEILHGKDVSILKKAIKEEKTPQLDHLPADALTLWKVSIPVEEIDTRLRYFQPRDDLDNGVYQLSPMDELSDIFQDKPPRKHIHIVVQPPGEGDLSRLTPTDLSYLCVASLNLSPAQGSADHKFNTAHVSGQQPEIKYPPRGTLTIWVSGVLLTMRAIDPHHSRSSSDQVFETKLRRVLERYLKENVQLPIWLPRGDRPRDSIWGHIDSLKIPSVLDTPSLLLHNIANDNDNLKRVNDIFNLNNTLK